VQANAWWKRHGGGNYPRHVPRATLPPIEDMFPDLTTEQTTRRLLS